MLKKYERVIKRVLNSTDPKKFPNLSKVGFINGFYYATDGYRMVRFEESPNELPVFGDNENHPNYEVVARGKEKTDISYTELIIPYTVKQIKAYRKATKGMKIPFYLGAKVKSAYRGSKHGIAINPVFLADAMELTGSNVLLIPEYGDCMLMIGNGFTFFVMGIWVQPDTTGYDSMTEITEE